MNKSQKRKFAKYVLERLEKHFPDAKIELNYNKDDPWELLVVVALSAQTTDKKVNEISRALFERFKTVFDFAKAQPKSVEPYLKSLGLYRNKAKNLVMAAKKIVSKFDAKVPKEREKLETLPGVGRKTSAVIVSNAFNIQAIAVDTHVLRVSTRLGLTESKNPEKIEVELTELFPKNKLQTAHHALIFHGRYICIAKKPRCSICPINEKCPKIGVTSMQ